MMEKKKRGKRVPMCAYARQCKFSVFQVEAHKRVCTFRMARNTHDTTTQSAAINIQPYNTRTCTPIHPHLRTYTRNAYTQTHISTRVHLSKKGSMKKLVVRFSPSEFFCNAWSFIARSYTYSLLS